jgi:hypothetical protein
MKLNLRAISAALLLTASTTAFAQFNESFEPVQGGLSTRDALKQQNWLFKDMDAESFGAITGAQSFITGVEYTPTQLTGLATPFLTFSNSEDLAFNYKLSRSGMSPARRWLVVNAVDTFGVVTQIDSVEMDIERADVITYAKNITGMSGVYSIYINFKGNGYSPRYMIDDISFTGQDAGLSYSAFTPVAPNQVVLGLNDAKKDITEMTIFPNPVNNEVNVDVALESSLNGKVEIYNSIGATVIAQPAMFNSGSNRVSLDVSSLAPGNYMLAVKTDNGVVSKKFTRVP